MMDGGMRPNFQPRFDGPPGFRGPPGPPHFDDFHQRGPRRYDDRRRYPKQHENEAAGGEEYERGERRSRWGGNSPETQTEDQIRSNRDEENAAPSQESNEGYNNDSYGKIKDRDQDAMVVEDEVSQENSQNNNKDIGNTTPLRDEVENDDEMKCNNEESVTIERDESFVASNEGKGEVREED